MKMRTIYAAIIAVAVFGAGVPQTAQAYSKFDTYNYTQSNRQALDKIVNDKAFQAFFAQIHKVDRQRPANEYVTPTQAAELVTTCKAISQQLCTGPAMLPVGLFIVCDFARQIVANWNNRPRLTLMVNEAFSYLAIVAAVKAGDLDVARQRIPAVWSTDPGALFVQDLADLATVIELALEKKQAGLVAQFLDRKTSNVMLPDRGGYADRASEAIGAGYGVIEDAAGAAVGTIKDWWNGRGQKPAQTSDDIMKEFEADKDLWD